MGNSRATITPSSQLRIPFDMGPDPRDGVELPPVLQFQLQATAATQWSGF